MLLNAIKKKYLKIETLKSKICRSYVTFKKVKFMNEFGDKIKYPVNYKFKINTDKINCY